MESHPAVLSTVGVATNHTNQSSSSSNRSTLTELDIINSEDILLISVNML